MTCGAQAMIVLTASEWVRSRCSMPRS